MLCANSIVPDQTVSKRNSLIRDNMFAFFNINVVFNFNKDGFFSHTRSVVPLFLSMRDISFSHTNAYEIG